jgi:hypothetical protein
VGLLCFRSRVAKLSILACDTVSLGNWLPTGCLNKFQPCFTAVHMILETISHVHIDTIMAYGYIFRLNCHHQTQLVLRNTKLLDISDIPAIPPPPPPHTVQQLLASQGRLLIEVLRSHSRHTTLGRTPLDE